MMRLIKKLEEDAYVAIERYGPDDYYLVVPMIDIQISHREAKEREKLKVTIKIEAYK